MEAQSETAAIGTAVVVYGTVKVVSADGVTKMIQPNDPIQFLDRIDTGQDGSVTVVFDDDGNQLELGNMVDMVIDQDVYDSGSDPDLADMTVGPELLQSDFLEFVEGEQVGVSETIVPEMTSGEDAAEALDADLLVSNHADNDLKENDMGIASTEAANDSGGSIEDDFDMSNLVPPTDDIT